MSDYLEIQFWKIAKWIIRRGYGANCETKDVDIYEGVARCASCKAKEVLEWIDEHIEVIKY